MRIQIKRHLDLFEDHSLHCVWCHCLYKLEIKRDKDLIYYTVNLLSRLIVYHKLCTTKESIKPDLQETVARCPPGR
jgi:hypothetical protein